MSRIVQVPLVNSHQKRNKNEQKHLHIPSKPPKLIQTYQTHPYLHNLIQTRKVILRWLTDNEG